MLKKVMIKITSKCEELSDSLFDRFMGNDNFEDGDFDDIDYALEAALNEVATVEFEFENEKEPEGDDLIEVHTEGRLRTTADRYSLSYVESELTGMEGATTTISFNRSNPSLLSMTRTGKVNTALIFEPEKRHICSYNTPFMPFELCIHTLKVKNNLLRTGVIELDYIIEIHGVQTERTIMKINVF